MRTRKALALWSEACKVEQTNPRLYARLLRQAVRLSRSDGGLMLNLAITFADGIGVKPELLQALAWNRRAWRRGYEAAATNAGIDAKLDGRFALAEVWFRRAVAMGDVDALLHLAKLLKSKRREEAVRLLRQRLQAGPEPWYEEVEGSVRLAPDKDLEEAKRLLDELTAASHD